MPCFQAVGPTMELGKGVGLKFLFLQIALFLALTTAKRVLVSAYRCVTVELAAFHPPSFMAVEDQRLNFLYPFRALRLYLVKTVDLPAFLSWAAPYKGKTLSRQRLCHWIVEAIGLAC
ncbi:hypothetical protein AOLI_G00269520 [Acnodon oligacanthus]